ncbi:hypothetical protein ACFXKD_12000 [Nocardiopsis aegyptia]
MLVGAAWGVVALAAKGALVLADTARIGFDSDPQGCTTTRRAAARRPWH